MKSLAAGITTALAAGTAVLVTLVKVAFPSGTVALQSSGWPTITVSGTDYLGAAGLGTISVITDTPEEIPGLQLELGWVDSAHLSLALDSVDEAQGAVVTISTLVLDASTYAQIGTVTDWLGYVDTMPIADDGKNCSVGLTCESKGVDLVRGTPLTYNDADQQSLYPGDRGFEYVTAQTDQPVVWPAREALQR